MMPCKGEIRRAAVDPKNIEWISRKFNSYTTENYLQAFEVDVRVFSDVRFVERSTNL